MNPDLYYWLWLTTKLDCRGAWRVLRAFATPEAVFHASAEDYRKRSGLRPEHQALLCDKSMAQAEEILRQCQTQHITILTYNSIEYPERLRQVEAAPLVLYVKGRLFRYDDGLVIAMAGSRKASENGVRTARRLSYDLTKSGVLVLSGVVIGCDNAAIEGALRAGGPVVAVLAGGVDICYYQTPHCRRLYDDILRNGALISEYPPGTPHLGRHFPMRNRILTGLAQGTLCVEANARSGVRKVAELAIDQNRDVYAVPANANLVSAVGTNHLLTEGLAIPVCTAEDILEHYPSIVVMRPRPQPRIRTVGYYPVPGESPALVKAAFSPVKSAKAETSTEKILETPLPDAEKKVDIPHSNVYIDLEALRSSSSPEEFAVLCQLKDTACSTDQLIAETGLTSSQIAVALTMLTVRGRISELPGNRFQIDRSLL